MAVEQYLRHAENEPAFVPTVLTRHSSIQTNGSENELLSPLDGSMQTSMHLDDEKLRMLTDASRKQLRWDHAMCSELKLPQGYKRVVALLFKWNKTEDQLKTEQEVKKLKCLFQSSFSFTTRVINLSAKCVLCKIPCKCTPQEQFNWAVSKYLKQFDRSNTLTLIYYTGHGTYHDPAAGEHNGYLRLHAHDQKEFPSFIWDQAESAFIKEAKGDVLTIMDACFAGAAESVVQREAGRSYEYLGACGKTNTTASPGDRSFTTALISSLQELASEGEPFTTADLWRVIKHQKYSLEHNPPCLITRSEHNDRRITFHPNKSNEVQGEKYFDDTEIPAYLDLRIELKQNDLSAQEIDELARIVARAVGSSNVKTRRVDWLRMASRKPTFKPLAWVAMFTASRTKLQRVPTMDTIAEETSVVPIKEPGFFATFGFLNSNLEPHFKTVSLLRPWTRVVGATIPIIAIAMLYSWRTSKAQFSPLRVFQSIWKGFWFSSFGPG